MQMQKGCFLKLFLESCCILHSPTPTIRGISAAGKRRAFKIMLKSSSEAHLASHSKLYLLLLADYQMSANPRTSHWRHSENHWRSVYVHDKLDCSLCSTPWIYDKPLMLLGAACWNSLRKSGLHSRAFLWSLACQRLFWNYRIHLRIYLF